MNSPITPQYGDIIYVNRGLYKHYGIYKLVSHQVRKAATVLSLGATVIVGVAVIDAIVNKEKIEGKA
jgi:hypothetical protein